MCTQFLIETDDGFVECETFGELKAALGGEGIAFHIEVSDMEDGDCLCPVDPEATAMRCGMSLDDDGFWLILRKRPMRVN